MTGIRLLFAVVVVALAAVVVWLWIDNDNLKTRVTDLEAVGADVTALNDWRTRVTTGDGRDAQGGTWTNAATDDRPPDPLPGVQFSGTTAVDCPPGFYVAGLQGFTVEGAIGEIRFFCRTLN